MAFLVTAIMRMVRMVRMVRTSGDAFAQEVINHRAFLAAESGAQLGLNRVFAPVGAGACGNWVWDLTALGLPACQVTVSCRTEVVQTVPHYTVESDGRCDVGGFIAQRRVLVRAVP